MFQFSVGLIDIFCFNSRCVCQIEEDLPFEESYTDVTVDWSTSSDVDDPIDFSPGIITEPLQEVRVYMYIIYNVTFSVPPHKCRAPQKCRSENVYSIYTHNFFTHPYVVDFTAET